MYNFTKFRCGDEPGAAFSEDIGEEFELGNIIFSIEEFERKICKEGEADLVPQNGFLDEGQGVWITPYEEIDFNGKKMVKTYMTSRDAFMWLKADLINGEI